MIAAIMKLSDRNIRRNMSEWSKKKVIMEYTANILIGIDRSYSICVVIRSSNPPRFPIKHKTKKKRKYAILNTVAQHLCDYFNSIFSLEYH